MQRAMSSGCGAMQSRGNADVSNGCVRTQRPTATVSSRHDDPRPTRRTAARRRRRRRAARPDDRVARRPVRRRRGARARVRIRCDRRDGAAVASSPPVPPRRCGARCRRGTPVETLPRDEPDDPGLRRLPRPLPAACRSPAATARSCSTGSRTTRIPPRRRSPTRGSRASVARDYLDENLRQGITTASVFCTVHAALGRRADARGVEALAAPRSPARR